MFDYLEKFRHIFKICCLSLFETPGKDKYGISEMAKKVYFKGEQLGDSF